MKNETKHAETIVDQLISYWQHHRGFDANIADLAKSSGVSRDTVYRWLKRKSLPKDPKLILISEWLDQRKNSHQ